MQLGLEKISVAFALSKVVNINYKIINVDSTLLNVMSFNIDENNVLSTLIWRCQASQRYINLKTTLNNVEMFAEIKSTVNDLYNSRWGLKQVVRYAAACLRCETARPGIYFQLIAKT